MELESEEDEIDERYLVDNDEMDDIEVDSKQSEQCIFCEDCVFFIVDGHMPNVLGN